MNFIVYGEFNEPISKGGQWWSGVFLMKKESCVTSCQFLRGGKEFEIQNLFFYFYFFGGCYIIYKEKEDVDKREKSFEGLTPIKFK